MPTRPRSRTPRLELQGALWLSVGGRDLGGHGRIGLLRAIVEQGTLTAAAQAIGLSYKAAWDAVQTMNELAGQPLVQRVTGGRGGGSSQLTPHGLRLLQRYEQIAALHRRFVGRLESAAMDLDRELSILEVLEMKTSARNQWAGVVGAIRAGAVNDEIEVVLPSGTRLVAIITRDSTEALGLRVKQPVIVMVKASAVLLGTELGDARLSARNRIDGTVAGIAPGAVNAEVTVRAADGTTVVAIVTQASVDKLGLKVGGAVSALVKASDLILATAA
ncbi:MAG TPA: TOBE domain-containing protein [Rubrivivax sp.]|nr:TOBE domain-containing protein [Rubrivivax sp.]